MERDSPARALCEGWAGQGDRLADQLLAWPDGAAVPNLAPRQHAILGYAAKLTRTPAEMRRDDVDALRIVGLHDEDVLALVEVVAYYAYANRIADGLGIRLEEG